MDKALLTYLYHKIIPIYRAFDQAHQMDHVEKVIHNALEIAKDYDVNQDMIYVIACYHDIGMQFGRKDHHLTGGLFLYEDAFLRSYFNEFDMMTMKEAIEDHRASNPEPPRTIYGKIIAEADRDIEPDIVFLRTSQFGVRHHPDLSFDEHFERAYQHVLEKYGHEGYLKLWLDTKKNREGLAKIRAYLADKDKMKEMFLSLYREAVEKS
jgi:uncharacterized protein